MTLPPDLKPCPFCGGPVQLEEANPSRDGLYGERRWWGVTCRNTINLGGSCCMDQVPSASKEAAIGRWNMRNGNRAAIAAHVPEAGCGNIAAVPAQPVSSDVLREALSFYADETRYHGPNQTLDAADKWTEQVGLKAYRLDVTRDRGVIAKKALAAAPQAVPVPAGWVLVPVEATQEMCAAAVKFANGNAVYKNVAAEALRIEEAIYGEAYAAMLASAPKEQPHE